MTAGHLMDGYPTFHSSIVNDYVYYDAQEECFLLRDQCAACGQRGHWRGDPKCSGEKNFPGKKGKLVAMASLHDDETFWSKGKGKGNGKGKGRPPPKGKGWTPPPPMGKSLYGNFGIKEKDTEKEKKREKENRKALWLRKTRTRYSSLEATCSFSKLDLCCRTS